MTKKRVNWTIEPACIRLLEQAKKLNDSKRIGNKKTTSCELVEYAILNTFSNHIEQLRNKAKHHQRELMRLTGQIEELEQTEKEKRDEKTNTEVALNV